MFTFIKSLKRISDSVRNYLKNFPLGGCLGFNLGINCLVLFGNWKWEKCPWI